MNTESLPVGLGKRPEGVSRYLFLLAVLLGGGLYAVARDQLWMDSAISGMEGQVLDVSPRHWKAVIAHPGSDLIAEFEVNNRMDHEVSVVGLESGCGCIQPADLPLRLSPGKSGRFKVHVSTKGVSMDEPLSQRARLFVDCPGQEIWLEVIAKLASGGTVSPEVPALQSSSPQGVGR